MKSLSYTIPISIVLSALSIGIFMIFYPELISHSTSKLVLVSALLIVIYFIIIHVSFQKITLHFLQKVQQYFPKHKPTTSQNIQEITQEISHITQIQQEKIIEFEDREQYRRDFLGNVSHELKTPLFTIQSYALTLADGAMKDKKVRKKYVNRINKNVDRLIAIVNDLDLINELERGVIQLHYTEFNVITLVQEVMEILELKAEKANVSLHFDKKYPKSVKVIGDIKKIEQVFINLLANAIKHSHKENTHVMVRLVDENDSIRISISDNGIGIKPENLHRIFERFYRVDSARSRKNGGSGLGLSIVKHILEAHNQSISVESEYQKGTTFSFTLQKNILG